MAAGAALISVAVVAAVVLLGGGSRRAAVPTHRPAPAPSPVPAPAAPALAPYPALPAPAAPALGISVNRLFLDRTYTPDQIDAQLRDLARTGATDARSDALWEATEPSPPVGGVHHYDWSFDDQIAGALAAHRLRWLPIIDYSPGWVQSIPGQEHSPPISAVAYGAYAAAVAARYGVGGSFWAAHPALSPEPVTALEIWNEPDGGLFWLPAPDPRGYANLYAAARAAVKAVAPDIRVIVGGLANLPGFAPALLSARPDLRGHIDGFGIHPYGPDPLTILRQVATDRAALNGIGLATVPLYATEFGWTPRPRGTTSWLPAGLRPSYIAATFAALAHTNCTIGGVFLYTWVTPERDPRNGEDWFGIHPPRGGGSTGSQAAFVAGIRAAKRARSSLKVC